MIWEMTQVTVRDLIGNDLPNVKIDNVTLEDNRVTVYLHIKDFTYDTGATTWASKKGYADLLKIQLAHSTTISGKTENKISKVLRSSEHLISMDYIKSGTGIKKIPYRIVLEPFSYENLTDLSFSARTIIEEDDIRIARGTKFRTSGLKDLTGNTDSVSVIASSVVQTRTTGYFLDGAYYFGGKHQMPNGRWMTGDSHSPESRSLLTRTVPNSRVADFRDIYQTNLPEISFDRRKYKITDRGDSYFSSFMNTRDVSGDMRFLFVFDYRKAYAENAMFGGMFSDLPERLQDRVLLNSSIRSLKVLRSRVGEKFENQTDELVVLSGEKTGDTFETANAVNGSLKEEELNFQKGTLFLRSFSGNDREFRTFSFGDYSYGTEIDIADGITSFLNFQLEDLDLSTKRLEEYRNEVNVMGNYDDVSDRFNEEFILKLRSTTEFENRPYIQALVSLSENAAFMLGSTSSEGVRKFNNTMRHWLSPRTSTKASIDICISIMKTISAKMHAVLSTLRPSAESRELRQTQSGKLKYSIKHSFSEEFDATKSFKQGLNFLSSTDVLETDKGVGIRGVEGEDFESRVSEEASRFIGNAGSVNFSIAGQRLTDNSFSFLTPTSARVDDEAYMFYVDNQAATSDEIVINSLSTGNEDDNYEDLFEQVVRIRIENFFGDDVEIFPTELGEPVEEFTTLGNLNVSNKTTRAVNNFRTMFKSKVQSVNNPFENFKVLKTLNTTSKVKESTERAINKRKLDNMLPEARFSSADNADMRSMKTDPFLLDEENMIQRATGRKTSPVHVLSCLDGEERSVKQSDIDKLPVHFKAILTDQANGNVSTDMSDAANRGKNSKYDLIVGSLAKVEALVGFATGNDGAMIKSPRFVPLTKEVYANNAGKNILCRVRPYDNSKVGYERSNSANIFNDIFVLKSPAMDANRLQELLNGATTQEEVDAILDSTGTDLGDRTRLATSSRNCETKEDARYLEAEDDAEANTQAAIIRRNR